MQCARELLHLLLISRAMSNRGKDGAEALRALCSQCSAKLRPGQRLERVIQEITPLLDCSGKPHSMQGVHGRSLVARMHLPAHRKLRPNPLHGASVA